MYLFRLVPRGNPHSAVFVLLFTVVSLNGHTMRGNAHGHTTDTPRAPRGRIDRNIPYKYYQNTGFPNY